MRKYKVEICKVKEAEELMKRLAGKGRRVISVIPNNGAGYGMVITFEREL